MALVDEPYEILYRAILPADELMWDKEFNRPSPALLSQIKKACQLLSMAKGLKKKLFLP
mgnify:CR=1 FL=1